MLKIEELGVNYGPLSVFDNVNLSFKPGSFTALLGANGIGKSSLLKAVAGIIPAKGHVFLGDGLAVKERNRSGCISYMPQDTGATSSLTVMEVVLLGRLRSLGMQIPHTMQIEVQKMLDGFGLGHTTTRTLNEISGGQRQLIYLAQSLFKNPQVLLLDEPTAALDLRHQLIVLNRIVNQCRQNNTIAIAAMHDPSLAAKFADRLICMSQGKIIADGAPSEVLTASLIGEVYGVDAEIITGTNGVNHVAPLAAIAL